MTRASARQLAAWGLLAAGSTACEGEQGTAETAAPCTRIGRALARVLAHRAWCGRRRHGPAAGALVLEDHLPGFTEPGEEHSRSWVLFSVPSVWTADLVYALLH